MGIQQMLLGGGKQGDVAGDIDHSLRFRKAASAYLTRVFSPPTNNKKWTYSVWMKRGEISTAQYLFNAGSNASGPDQANIQFLAGDTLQMSQTQAAATTSEGLIVSTSLHRDPSAHFHLVAIFDSDNAVATDRQRLYINGVRLPVTVSTQIAQGLASRINAARVHDIGRFGGGSLYADGLMSRICFVDGQALPPSYFGEFNTDGVWVSKTKEYIKGVVDGAGKNNFMLEFEDGSRLSSEVTPPMTSNTTPAGWVVAASSELSATYQAWKAFDQNNSTYGWITAVGGMVSWLSIQLDAPRAIHQYSMYLFAVATAARQPKTWRFMGWDGAGWVLLHAVTNDPAWTFTGERRVYNIPAGAVGSYLSYAIFVDANHGDTQYTEIDTLALHDGTGLGYDSSIHGNHWGVVNTSVTAGPTYDWLEDTPSNNFATLSFVDKVSTSVTLTNANLSVYGGANLPLRATQAVNSGKWYWEQQITQASAATVNGILNAPEKLASYIGSTIRGYGYSSLAAKWNNGVQTAYGATYTLNDIIGVAFDADAGTLEFFKNGVSQGVAFTGIPADFYAPAYSCGTSTVSAFNFGQRPFAYTPPSGFKALCTKNLPNVAITNPVTMFDAVLATGATIKGACEALFSGNVFEWIKDRANANSFQLLDIVRGLTGNKALQSNTTGAEVAYANPVGNSVGWTWKAGGAAVANTDGTIPSMVSANIEAGFSIVSYTGSGANASIGHGLDVAPKMIIQKPRQASGSANNWQVYHRNGQANAAEAYIAYLNATSMFTNSPTYWQNKAPDADVFYVGTHPDVNAAVPHIAYCFAEVEGYSKFGSYSGNGAVDGPFIYCGFRPKFIMVKTASGAAANWGTVDSSRDDFNPAKKALYFNANNAETLTNLSFDMTANGFKLRIADAQCNANGYGYVFMAFAENPFGGANVAPANAVGISPPPPPMAIGGSISLTWNQGSAVSVSAAAWFTGGVAPLAYSISGGTLPNGVTLNASTGLISGTPSTQAAATTVKVRCTDAGSRHADQSFNVTVAAPLSGTGGVITAAVSSTFTGYDTVTPFGNVTPKPFVHGSWTISGIYDVNDVYLSWVTLTIQITGTPASAADVFSFLQLGMTKYYPADFEFMFDSAGQRLFKHKTVRHGMVGGQNYDLLVGSPSAGTSFTMTAADGGGATGVMGWAGLGITSGIGSCVPAVPMHNGLEVQGLYDDAYGGGMVVVFKGVLSTDPAAIFSSVKVGSSTYLASQFIHYFESGGYTYYLLDMVNHGFVPAGVYSAVIELP